MTPHYTQLTHFPRFLLHARLLVMYTHRKYPILSYDDTQHSPCINDFILAHKTCWSILIYIYIYSYITSSCIVTLMYVKTCWPLLICISPAYVCQNLLTTPHIYLSSSYISHIHVCQNLLMNSHMYLTSSHNRCHFRSSHQNPCTVLGEPQPAEVLD